MYKFAIDRPITTLMMVFTLIVFGLISFRSMPVSLFPSVDFPVVTVQTPYPGADAGTVESRVTDKIEEAVSGIDGIDKLQSTSTEGVSIVTVIFDLEKDVTEAANDVRDKIGGVILPPDVEKPIVKKVDSGGSSVINLFISTKKDDLKSLMVFADELAKPKLQRVKGVGEVNIVGYRDREIRIFTDPFLLNKYKISMAQINGIIARENFRSGGGKLIGKKKEYVIKARGDAQTIEELKNIRVIPGVLLKDIARVEDSLGDIKSFASLNGKEGVILEVKKISGENTLDIIKGVKKVFPDIEKMAAGDELEMNLIQDQSEKILVNIDNVKFDLFLGAMLSITIVFFFLRNVTATIVAALAIPTSIIGTFALIDWLGYDLNKLTMIGLTLAIGIFIDDAIVVIENISKKLEAGTPPFKAASEGIGEIAFSILAISAVLLAVFVPVAFMSGIVGRFFNSFAMTVASGILISFFVAVMFIPSVGARILKKGESRFFHVTEPFFVALDRFYVKILKPLVRFKTFTLVGAIVILVVSTKFKVGMDFVPMQDNSEFQVILKAPVGISLEEMKRKIEPLTETIKEDNKIEYSFVSIGYNTAKDTHKAKIYAKLLPVEMREKSQSEIVAEFRERFKDVKDLFVAVEQVPAFDTGESNAPVQFVIKGASLERLEELSFKVKEILESKKGAVDIDTDYEKGKPEVRISINRQSADRVGIAAQSIANVLITAFSSDRGISTFEDEGKQFDITLRFEDKYRDVVDDIKRIQVLSKGGEQISLEGVVNIEESTGVSAINRFDRERKILITANVDDVPLDSIMTPAIQEVQKMLPSGYSYKITGSAERMAETGKAFGAAIGLAVVLIFIILAALYESLIQPLIIMVAMPLSFTGVILGLYFSGYPFSLFVMIGVILLLGMVGKNAILVVDYANRAVKEGMDVDSAIIKAGEKRLRPILMTTFAMIGAMIPLAFGGGAGHESNSPMAIAIIGGLLSSTILTLLVVPAIYRFLYPVDAWLRKFYDKDLILRREQSE